MDNLSYIDEKLEQLTSVFGVSSDESKISEILLDELKGLCVSAYTDKCGNIIGLLNEYDSSIPTIMLEAHMDRVGLMIKDIDDDGRISFVPIGGIDERTLLFSEVVFCKNRELSGIIVPLDFNTDGNDISNYRIEIGCSNSEAKSLIKKGDLALIKSKYTHLADGCASCAAMDNRAGIVSILNAVKTVDKSSLKCNVEIMFSTGEETGLYGAYLYSPDIIPDIAIVVDVTHGMTHDTKDMTGVFPLGSGAIICRGPNFNDNLSLKLIDIAKSNSIPYIIEVASGFSGTTAWALQTANGGVATTLISIPLKYMHTNVETLALSDISAVSELIEKALKGDDFIA